ncbi:MAG: hypothetical protein WBP10_13965 [Thermoanaerobaculia bacterium]
MRRERRRSLDFALAGCTSMPRESTETGQPSWRRCPGLRVRYNFAQDEKQPVSQEAIDQMQARGRFMWRYPQLNPQVEALGEWIAGEPCDRGVEACLQPVDPTSEGLQADGSFPLDSCPGQSDSEVGR